MGVIHAHPPPTCTLQPLIYSSAKKLNLSTEAVGCLTTPQEVFIFLSPKLQLLQYRGLKILLIVLHVPQSVKWPPPSKSNETDKIHKNSPTSFSYFYVKLAESSLKCCSVLLWKMKKKVVSSSSSCYTFEPSLYEGLRRWWCVWWRPLKCDLDQHLSLDAATVSATSVS